MRIVIRVLVVAAGQKFQRFFKTLRRFAQAFAIRIFADQLDDFANVAGNLARIERFFFVASSDLFRWFRHCSYLQSLLGYSPAYSKLLLRFPESERVRASPPGKISGAGKFQCTDFPSSEHVPRNAGTSSLSELVVEGLEDFAFTKPSRSARLAIMPVAGSIFPERQDFDNVVVPVSVGDCCTCRRAAILFLSEMRGLCRRCEAAKSIAPAEFDLDRAALRFGTRSCLAPPAPLR